MDLSPNESSNAANINSHSYPSSVSAVGDDEGEQSRNLVDVRHLRRIISRRESARRCRRRKEKHLADLEFQVEQHIKDNASLIQQLTSATQLYREAETNCQVLNNLYLSVKEQLENEMARSRRVGEERGGADIVKGSEDCYRHSKELLEEIELPRGVVPRQELVECGRVRETGFVWMKQKAPSHHYLEFEGKGMWVSYDAEVTGYVEKFRMNKISGMKMKQGFAWVPVTELTAIEDPAGNKLVHLKSPMQIGKSLPFMAFITQE